MPSLTRSDIGWRDISIAAQFVQSTLMDIALLRTEKLNLSGFASLLFLKRNLYTLTQGRDNESSATYRYLSETGLRKDVKSAVEKASNEDGEEGSQEKIDVEELYEAGVTLYRQGKLRLALEAFENVLSESPQHFAALFHKGNSLLKLKCYEEALETFEEASGVNPGHAGLWTNIGFALMKLERFKQALEAFERSISLNPVQKNAWEGKETVLKLIHQCEEDLKGSRSDPEEKSL